MEMARRDTCVSKTSGRTDADIRPRPKILNRRLISGRKLVWPIDGAPDGAYGQGDGIGQTTR